MHNETVFSNIGGHFTFEKISAPCQIPRQIPRQFKDVQGAGEAQGLVIKRLCTYKMWPCRMPQLHVAGLRNLDGLMRCRAPPLNRREVVNRRCVGTEYGA